MRASRAWVGFAAGAMGLWVLIAAPPAVAGIAAIEATATLSDQSEASVKAAVDQAVATAIQGAKAMGLPRVELRGARVLPGAVTVLIIAKDVEVDPLEEMFGGTSDGAEEGESPAERRPTL